MINKTHKPLQKAIYNLSLRYFGALPKDLDLGRYKIVYKRVEENEDFVFTLPIGEKKYELILSEHGTIDDLKEQVLEFSKETKLCEAYSLDKAEIAGLTKLQDIRADGFYLLLDRKELLQVVSLESTDAIEQEKRYSRLETFCDKTGVPFLERKILVNYLKRVDALNQEKFSKPLFSDKNFHTGTFFKKDLIANMIEGLSNPKSQQFDDEQALYDQYHKIKCQIEELKNRRSELERKAHKKAKMKMSLGLLALTGQFWFVAAGTYVIWSWDIVEPMVYFMDLGASIVFSYHFMVTYKNYSKKNFFNFIKQRELEKIYANENFPAQELERLEDQMKMVERMIKSSIVINL